MGSSEERMLAHARVLRSRGLGERLGAAAPPAEILDSWVRCAQAGLDLAAPPAMVVLEDAELRRRREQLQHVRRLALAELETLFQQIAGSNFLLAFADRDGVILDLYADNRFSTSSSSAPIVVGSLWSEALAGTNGLGTALATQRSVAVNGPEHFFPKFSAISCTAAPIHDAFGELVGVLDASSYFESRQRHTQALVQMSASNIENVLLAHQMRGHTVLAIHPRAEFLHTLGAGLMAFAEDGTLQAVNARARALLVGLDLRRGTAFEQIFDAAFDRAAGRLAVGAELRLHDAMGSALAMACVSRPAAPKVHEPAAAAGWPATRAAPPETALVAGDERLREAIELVAAAVRLNAPVLIEGETGSGKEMLARHAHAASGRPGAFVAVNCAAMPAELFEAELFGYVGGAFTGARRDGAIGLVASADGGTLLLDEVGELSPALQAALLRFLDDRKVRPVGGAKERAVDVQVLAATNADLELAVADKRFRADLLYRLNIVRIVLPPLRERRDFDAVVRSTLQAIDATASIDDDAVARLGRHAWPGNFRELRAVLTRALLRTRAGARLGMADVAAVLPGLPAPPRDGAPSPAGSVLARGVTEAVLREYERSGRSVSRTARSLGVSRTTVYRHLRMPGAPKAA